MKVIYITWNYEAKNFPNQPDQDDRFYTYGFGSGLSRKFKLYNPEWEVECWRTANNINKYYEKTVQDVKFRIFPSIYIKSFGDFSIKFLRELRNEVNNNNPILVVTHIHHWLLYQIAWFFRTSPIIVTSHGEYSPFFRFKISKGLKKIKAFVEMQIEKMVLRNINKFLLCDNYQKEYITEITNPETIGFSTNGVNFEYIKPMQKNMAREELGWDKNKKYLLYVGLLYNLKMTKEMVDLWKELKSHRSEIELVIIGNNKDDEFYDYAVKAGALVLGRILNSDLNKYYSAADAFLLLSIRNDWFGGIGIAPLESLACNTPVISRSLRNYIGDNIEELGEIPYTLEEYKHAILKVLDKPEKYKNMRESVLKYYSWEYISKNTETVFREILNKMH